MKKVSFKSKYNITPQDTNSVYCLDINQKNSTEKSIKKTVLEITTHYAYFFTLHPYMSSFEAGKTKISLTFTFVTHSFNFYHAVLLPLLMRCTTYFCARPWFKKKLMVRISTPNRRTQSFIFFSFSGHE